VKRIIIAGEDWQSRAMLRAQLLEDGFAVEAHETIAEALAVLERETVLPEMMLADVSASRDPAADLTALAPWSHKIPLWIIASRAYRLDEGLHDHAFEIILPRPVDVGELVDRIKQRMADPG
jgi:DNA-binding response OmpR family regulator